ncbi:MAG: mechanosensitive ion channel [Kineosporiaceae bacterium]|nr:mechanosensitive ion channel [Aeromicrobium sp.]
MDIKRSFQTAVDAIVGFLPNLLAFLIILLVGFVIAKVVSKIVFKALEKLGVDRKLKESEAHNYVEKIMPGASPSSAVATVAFWFIFIFFLVAAIGALKIPAVTVFMNQVLAYLPNVIAAMLIFVIAAIVAGVVAGVIVNFMGDTPTGKIAAAVVPAIVMVIAMFMVLEQLRIAQSIVQIAFAATVGALALGLALAFGLGGRSVAQRILEEAYSKGQAQKDQVKADIQTGRERAEQAASKQRDTVEGSPYTAETSTTSTFDNPDRPAKY